jgi:hypothetical protein
MPEGWRNQALARRALELADAYEILLAEAETAAVRWSWTAGGRRLVRPPGLPWHAHVAVGADVCGRTVWTREYDETGEVATDRFTTWRGRRAESTTWRAPSDLPGRPAAPQLLEVRWCAAAARSVAA